MHCPCSAQPLTSRNAPCRVLQASNSSQQLGVVDSLSWPRAPTDWAESRFSRARGKKMAVSAGFLHRGTSSKDVRPGSTTISGKGRTWYSLLTSGISPHLVSFIITKLFALQCTGLDARCLSIDIEFIRASISGPHTPLFLLRAITASSSSQRTYQTGTCSGASRLPLAPYF